MNNSSQKFALVQVQDETGMWRDTATTVQSPQSWGARMQEATFNHPDKRGRVVDQDGRLLDVF